MLYLFIIWLVDGSGRSPRTFCVRRPVADGEPIVGERLHGDNIRCSNHQHAVAGSLQLCLAPYRPIAAYHHELLLGHLVVLCT